MVRAWKIVCVCLLPHAPPWLRWHSDSPAWQPTSGPAIRPHMALTLRLANCSAHVGTRAPTWAPPLGPPPPRGPRRARYQPASPAAASPPPLPRSAAGLRPLPCPAVPHVRTPSGSRGRGHAPPDVRGRILGAQVSGTPGQAWQGVVPPSCAAMSAPLPSCSRIRRWCSPGPASYACCHVACQPVYHCLHPSPHPHPAPPLLALHDAPPHPHLTRTRPGRRSTACRLRC